jgi:small basic protein (TIGR04137 family)
MSLHRSLKTTAGALNEHRNVLTRAERIARLMERDRFEPGKDSPLALPKVANRQLVTKKKKVEKEQETLTEGAEATPAAPAPGS